MSLVYVFASSKMEAQPVRALAPKNPSTQPGRAIIGEVGENRFAVIITGMGTGNARTRADPALAVDGAHPATQKPDAILVIGLCGGLTDAMQGERLVAYTECLSTDKSPPLQCSAALTDAIFEILQKRRITCDQVTGITSPRIASNESQKLSLAQSGASVVDMETYQVLAAAARAGVPAAVLRVVADPLDTDMPDFNSALDANGGLIGSKAIWIALGSPFETWHLLAMNKRAMARLAPAVKFILESSCLSTLKSPIRNCSCWLQLTLLFDTLADSLQQLAI
jgi:adenosylhomocysteine nucleosidase